MQQNLSVHGYIEARDSAPALLAQLAFGDAPVRSIAPAASAAIATLRNWRRHHRLAALHEAFA